MTILSSWSCGGPGADVRDCGFDAAYAYNWGKDGYDADFTARIIRSQQDLDFVHVVPTASTGFNNVAWAETRSPNMTAEDFKKLHTVFRDEMRRRSQKTRKNRNGRIALS